MMYGRALCSLALSFVLMTAVDAEVGACRFDTDRCSCKVGDANKGVCWDGVNGAPGQCKRRFCSRGWTCACGGRTHVCYRTDRQAFTVAPANKGKVTAPCTASTVQVSSGREISLGTFRNHISPKGAAANECLEVAWWHNGELMGNYKPVAGLNASNVPAELLTREVHTSLELRGGDVIAWRYRDGSYYCQQSRVDLVVNGTNVDLNTPGVDLRYARAFTTDWYEPTFEPLLGDSEDENDLQKFLPARTRTFAGKPILPNGDLFQALNASDPDHKPTNVYWRLTLPYNLTTTYTNEPVAATPAGGEFGEI